MVLSEVPSLLVDVGTVAGAVVAVLAALAAASRSRPFRWVWSHLVSGPIGDWQRKQIETAVAPLKKEISSVGGALVSHMDDEYDLRLAEVQERALRQTEMDTWRDEVREDISQVRSDIGTLHRRVDSALVTLVAGNPEIRDGVNYDPGREAR